MLKRLILLILTLIFLPGIALAADIRSRQERVTIPASETVNDDLYIATGQATVNGTVNGDVFVAAGQVRVSGKVNGDLFVAGGNITIDGQVGDDLRVAGGNVIVSGSVGDDLFLAGGTTEVSQGARVTGGVWVGAGTLTVAGETGPVKAQVGNLVLASTAQINGDVIYTSSNEADIETEANITGSVTRRTPPFRPGLTGVFTTLSGILSMVMTIVVGLLFVYLLPNKAAAVVSDWRSRFATNLVWGFLFLLAWPIAAVLFLVSVVGFPIGLGALLVYPIFLYLGLISGVVALGAWTQNLMERDRKVQATWLAVILGTIAVTILGFIPILGWLAVFIVFLVGLGALVKYDWGAVGKLRANKTI